MFVFLLPSILLFILYLYFGFDLLSIVFYEIVNLMKTGGKTLLLQLLVCLVLTCICISINFIFRKESNKTYRNTALFFFVDLLSFIANNIAFFSLIVLFSADTETLAFIERASDLSVISPKLFTPLFLFLFNPCTWFGLSFFVADDIKPH